MRSTASLIALLITGLPVSASAFAAWKVRPEWVEAHEAFLASDALQGRGSATRDEAIAAAYVASQFKAFGLSPTPGSAGYLQTANIYKYHLAGTPVLTLDGLPLAGATFLRTGLAAVHGKPVTFAGDDVNVLPAADVVIVTGKPGLRALLSAAKAKKIGLLILAESDSTRGLYAMTGSKPALPVELDGVPQSAHVAVVALPAAAFSKVADHPDTTVSLGLPDITRETMATTNAIGYLRGSDPEAGAIFLSAHLDHLGVRADGKIMHGANDDASGTTAVLEIAHALSSKRATRRSIVFVCYGSEEIGEFGSRYLADHPPVPLDNVVADIEFEMIAARDPQFPDGSLMMTGFDRSNLGKALKAHGAPVGPDPYTDQHFFERSDNYQLALKGTVAHTVSAWPSTPTYHQPTDTLANIDLGYMTRTIQSFIPSIRWLADSSFRPEWIAGGKPAQ